MSLRPSAPRNERRASAPRRRPAGRPRVDRLEERCLMAVSITDFAVPTPNSQPYGVRLFNDGSVFFTERAAGQIGKIAPGASSATEIATLAPGSFPIDVVQGPDGSAWFTEFAANKIGRVGVDGGTPVEFAVPTPDSAPGGIVVGPDGALWFTEQLGNKVGRYLPGNDLSAAMTGAGAVAGSNAANVLATFTDRTPGAASSYAATIDWGDGSPATAGTIVRSGSGFAISGGHAYAHPGTFPVTVSVGEPSGEIASTSAALVARAGRPATGVVSVPRRGPVKIVLTLDGPGDPATIGDATRYTISLPGRGGVFGAKGSKTIRVKAASYDANAHTVTLTPRGALPKRGAMQVAVRDAGIVTIGR